MKTRGKLARQARYLSRVACCIGGATRVKSIATVHAIRAYPSSSAGVLACILQLESIVRKIEVSFSM